MNVEAFAEYWSPDSSMVLFTRGNRKGTRFAKPEHGFRELDKRFGMVPRGIEYVTGKQFKIKVLATAACIRAGNLCCDPDICFATGTRK